MSWYSELCRDPRWQRRRLETMDRDGFACRKCGTTTGMLNVHHTRYISGRAPWEYPDDILVTICEDCHATEHGKAKPLPFRVYACAPHAAQSEEQWRTEYYRRDDSYAGWEWPITCDWPRCGRRAAFELDTASICESCARSEWGRCCEHEDDSPVRARYAFAPKGNT